jgi:hypothetical protein
MTDAAVWQYRCGCVEEGEDNATKQRHGEQQPQPIDPHSCGPTQQCPECLDDARVTDGLTAGQSPSKARTRSGGAQLGLTPRQYQSGASDRSSRILSQT